MSATEIDQESTDRLCILALNKRSWHHSKAGGSEHNLEETLTRLADRGHSVYLLTGSDEGRDREEIDNDVTIRRIGIDDRVGAPWDVVVSYLLVSIYFYWYQYHVAPDVVYTVNTPLPWPVFTSCSRVSIFHHIAIDSFFETHPFPQNLFGFLAQWTGVLRERKNPTVSVSPSTTAELVSRGHDPATIAEITNGIDPDRYTPGSESETPRILYIGGLERYKGVDRIPEIHQTIINQANEPVGLDVAGRDGPLSEEIADYCEREETATFHGFVSLDRKVELLQSAWVYIAPSRVEGWGIVVLEANACATPAVGNDIGGLRDSIQDGTTGYLVPERDYDAFASQVVQLFEDETREKFGNEARDWAEKHSWERSVDDFEQLFAEVSDSE
ncbi:glycosyltransferase family 4 protein [Haloarchaeobius sp. TZWSO28]|uniref:glycosyltransferase family 4 protein n=1 Tax=Haloarchaeobius sp. TZWSO28 TaxID=3446119 RepID=UPI003EBC6370